MLRSHRRPSAARTSPKTLVSPISQFEIWMRLVRALRDCQAARESPLVRAATTHSMPSDRGPLADSSTSVEIAGPWRLAMLPPCLIVRSEGGWPPDRPAFLVCHPERSEDVRRGGRRNAGEGSLCEADLTNCHSEQGRRRPSRTRSAVGLRPVRRYAQPRTTFRKKSSLPQPSVADSSLRARSHLASLVSPSHGHHRLQPRTRTSRQS
jgi:hypothetical protein